MAKPKPLEKFVQTGFRLSETRKKELEEVAKLRGQSVQSLIDEAVELRLQITEGFWDQISQIADKLKIPSASVITNIIIKQSAFQFAWVKVFGTPAPGLFREFRFDAEGFMTGERLSETLVKEYTQKLEKFKNHLVDLQKSDEPFHYFSEEEASFLLGGQL